MTCPPLPQRPLQCLVVVHSGKEAVQLEDQRTLVKPLGECSRSTIDERLRIVFCPIGDKAAKGEHAQRGLVVQDER